MFIKRAFLKKIYKAEEELKNNNEESIGTSKSLLIAPACDVIDKNHQRHATIIQDKYILLSFENIIKLTHKKDDIPVNYVNASFFEEYVKNI